MGRTDLQLNCHAIDGELIADIWDTIVRLTNTRFGDSLAFKVADHKNQSFQICARGEIVSGLWTDDAKAEVE